MQAARWFGVGSAEGLGDGVGARAVDDALRGDDAKLLVVFCSQSHDLPALLREIRTRAGDVPLIGCTTAGEIAASGPRDRSVVVVALGGDGFAVDTACATEASRGLREAGAAAARCVPERDDLPHKVLLLLTDGLAGDQQRDRPRRLRSARSRGAARRRLRRRRPEDDEDVPASRRRGADRRRGRRRHRVGRAARNRRPPRLATRGRADARHLERRQPRLHARRPTGARRLPRAPRA